jgi:flagellar motor switch protein FliM
MAKVLSQEEVDSLLNGIGDGKIETEKDVPKKDNGIELCDFSRKKGPVHLGMDALGMINERFINMVNESLSVAMGSVIEVNISAIDSIKYGEFTKSLPLPASMNIMKMEPLRGFALLYLEGALVFAFVDTLFGGKGASRVKLEGKSFTAIERKIVDRIVGLVLKDLQKAWAVVQELKMVCTRSEMDPQFVGIAKPGDMIIATKFNITVGNFSGGMAFCIPYDMIEPIRKKLRENFQSVKIEVDHTWRRHIEGRISELDIGLKCTLGSVKMTGRELLGIKAGDLILTDKKADDTVSVSVGNITKFRGYLGSVNNKKAVRITEKVIME